LILQQQQYSGPLPPPAALEHYERISPGLSDRIVRMAEAEAQHRRLLERHEQDFLVADGEQDRKERKRGQVFALVIAVIALACSTGCAVYGATVVASIIGGTTIVGLVTAFIIGQRQPPPND